MMENKKAARNGQPSDELGVIDEKTYYRDSWTRDSL